MKKISASINNLNERFWFRLIKSTSSNIQSLAIFRIFTGLFLLLFYSPLYGWIGQIPRQFFNPQPLSVAIFFSGLPSLGFFLAADIILLFCTAFITLGIKTKISSLVYCAVNIIVLPFQYSLGQIDHLIFIYVLIACLSFSGWGNELAIIPDKKATENQTMKSLTLLAALICFGFFSAGFFKAIHWANLDFNKSGSAWWFYNEYYAMGHQYLLAPLLTKLPLWQFKIMDYIAVMFELSGILFLIHSKRAWRWWLFIACIFHVLNILFLNISFLTHTIVYLAFADFSDLYHPVKTLVQKTAARLIFTALLFLLVSVRLYYIFSFKAITTFFTPNYSVKATLIISLIIFAITLLKLLADANKKQKSALNSATGSPKL